MNFYLTKKFLSNKYKRIMPSARRLMETNFLTEDIFPKNINHITKNIVTEYLMKKSFVKEQPPINLNHKVDIKVESEKPNKVNFNEESTFSAQGYMTLKIDLTEIIADYNIKHITNKDKDKIKNLTERACLKELKKLNLSIQNFRVEIIDSQTGNPRLKDNEIIIFNIGNIIYEVGVDKNDKIKMKHICELCLTFANNRIEEEIAAKLLSSIGLILENPLLINI